MSSYGRSTNIIIIAMQYIKDNTKLCLLFFAIFSLFKSSSYSQSCYNYTIDTLLSGIRSNSITTIVHELTGDIPTIVNGHIVTIVTRAYNYPMNDTAAAYVYQRFDSYGLNPSYFQFSVTGKDVVGQKVGLKYPNKKYIICGHYDSYPWQPRSIGADDNATGTCTVLEAARLLSTMTFDYTLVFIAMDEEERGLYGSKAYADTSYAHGDSIIAVVNVDMVAYDANHDERVKIITNSASIYYANVVNSATLIYVPYLIPNVSISGSSGSDHYSFWQRGYKAVWPFEDDYNPHVNSMQDTITWFNYKYFLTMVRAIVASFAVLGKDYLIDFYHTPIVSSTDTSSRTATVVIKSPKKIAYVNSTPKLYFKINSGIFTPVGYYYNNLDTFKFMISGAPISSVISYYFAAQDSAGNFVGTLPIGGRGVNPPGTIQPPTLFQYSILTGIAENTEPVHFSLGQNYPNPFNPVTRIDFTLAKNSDVKMLVFDVLGRQVEELVNGKLPEGNHTVEFEANNLSSGMYFYSFYLNGSLVDTKKMILLK